MIPSTAPQSAITEITISEGFAISLFSIAHIKRAGSVKIAPAARDSPAEPIVCTMLFSRIEFLLMITRIIPIESTAAGIDAEIVIPTLSPKYALAAPKTIAKMIPTMMATGVISGST